MGLLKEKQSERVLLSELSIGIEFPTLSNEVMPLLNTDAGLALLFVALLIVVILVGAVAASP